ncbi:MAG TPA: TetR family transcriptional regulator [Baekduia sp.]|nr:TetR family transcriptional regulator [Baekduia sp.]
MVPVKQPAARPYGGRTNDERVAQRHAALLHAAFALVAEDGWRALRIDALCRAAALNKRYFYESFDGLEAVVAALTKRLAEDAIAVALGAIEPGVPAREATRQAIAAIVGHLTDDPRRARVLFGAVPAADAAAGHRADALRQVITAAAATGRDLHDLGADPAVDLAASMLVGGTSQVLLDWLDGRIACDRDRLVDDLVALWQVIGDATAAASRGPRGH